MKYIFILPFFVPSFALAHAVPTSYTPDHGAILSVPPVQISITFSDRVDPQNAALTLYGATSSPERLGVHMTSDDARTIYASVPEIFGGATLVWGVTSLDDGHYTHGAFNFAVSKAGESKSPRGGLGNETQIAALLFAASCILLVLRVASLLYLERTPRCALCVRSYTLLEALMGGVVTTLLVLSFVLPSAYWVREKKEDGISLRLSGALSSPRMTLTVEGVDSLPDPLFEVGNREASVDPMPIPLSVVSRNAHGGVYSFPTSVFVPHGNWHVSTTFIQGDRYDAHGAMNFIYPDDLSKTGRRWSHISPSIFPLYVFAFILLCSLLLRLFTLHSARDIKAENPPRITALAAYGATMVAFITFLVALTLLAALS